MERICFFYASEKSLRAIGFTEAQLASLFAVVGGDNRDTIDEFYKFIQQLQENSPTPASNLIQIEGQRNALLQSIIRTFSSLRSRCPKASFNDVLDIYEKRLKSKGYHAVLERGCSQELIDSLMDIYAERDNTSFGLYSQGSILESVKKHLTPHLGADHKENSALVAGILAECRKRLGENPKLRNYEIEELVGKICSEFVSHNQPQSSSSAGSSQK